MREREIMLLIAEGFIAKQIAAKLHLSEVTIKVHRARMMRKLELRSSIEVARLVDTVCSNGARQSLFSPTGADILRAV
jgi:DNA-binding NarL/FixJ family response regulator